MGGGYLPSTLPQTLGALAVLLATINVSGGFIITKRMLDMFKRKLCGYVSFIFLIRSQVHLTLWSILGFTLSLQSSSRVVSLLRRVREWQGLCRQVTSRVASFASV